MLDAKGDGSLIYVAQVEIMKDHELTTMYVDFSHILKHDDVLAQAIQTKYYRFMPYLKRAVHNLVAQFAPEYLQENPSARSGQVGAQAKDFSVAFYHLPLVSGIRQLKTDRIGTLMSVSGTVTRTSEVRPELLYGSFICEACGALVNDIEQQFKYTEVCLFQFCNVLDQYLHVGHSQVFVPTQRVEIVLHGSSRSALPASRIGKKFGSKKTRPRFRPVQCHAHLTLSCEVNLSNVPRRVTNASLLGRLLLYPTSARWACLEGTKQK